MSKVKQFGQIRLTKFTSAAYALSTNSSDIVTIVKDDIDSDQDLVHFDLSRDVQTKNLASGNKLMYTGVGGTAMSKFFFVEETGNTENTRIRNFLYSLASPDSLVNTDSRREFFNAPGQDYGSYQNQVRMVFTPYNISNELDASNQVVIPVGQVTIVEQEKHAMPNTLEVTINGVGGKRLVTLTSTANLSSNVNLSTGSTDKLVSITIDGETKDVNFGQSSTKTRTQILSDITTAFGSGSAVASGTQFIQLVSSLSGADIQVGNPSSGTSGLTLVFGFTGSTRVSGVYPLIEK